jgi:hypothetical protein
MLSQNTKEEIMQLMMESLDLRSFDVISKLMFQDEFMFGVSGVKVTEREVRLMTVSEVLEKYGDLLTDLQKNKIIEAGNEGKN